MIKYLLDLFEFKGKIEDLGTKFKENEFLYLPKLSVDDINHYFILKCRKNYGFDLNINKDIQQLEINIFNDDEVKELINDFKINGLPEIKKFDKGIKDIISIIEDEDWNKNFSWLKKSYEELKNESWKNPNQLLLKKKHNLMFDDSKKIYDAEKIDITSLFSVYESKKPAITKKWKTFPEIDIQNISKKMEINNSKNEYGYRIMELYDFDLFRDDISQSMIIIINSINKLLVEKLGNYIKEQIVKIISKFYEDYIIEKVVKEEIPNQKNTKILEIFQYLLFYFCKIYEKIYDEELEKNKKEIKNKKINLKNIIEEISNKSIEELKEKNNKYKEKERIFEEEVAQEIKKAKLEFSKNKNIFEGHLDFEKKFEGSIEYENYTKIILNLSKPNKNDFEMNNKYIEMLEETKKNIINLENIEDLEEIKDIIKEIKINKLETIDNNEYKKYNSLKKDILQIINEINDMNIINEKLNLLGVKKLISDDIKNDKYIN